MALRYCSVLIALGKIWDIDNIVVLPLLLLATLAIANLSYRYVEHPPYNSVENGSRFC